jgi:hypothetical protein
MEPDQKHLALRYFPCLTSGYYVFPVVSSSLCASFCELWCLCGGLVVSHLVITKRLRTTATETQSARRTHRGLDYYITHSKQLGTKRAVLEMEAPEDLCGLALEGAVGDCRLCGSRPVLVLLALPLRPEDALGSPRPSRSATTTRAALSLRLRARCCLMCLSMFQELPMIHKLLVTWQVAGVLIASLFSQLSCLLHLLQQIPCPSFVYVQHRGRQGCLCGRPWFPRHRAPRGGGRDCFFILLWERRSALYPAPWPAQPIACSWRP